MNLETEFRFLPGNRLDWKAIKNTYSDFFRQGLSFWTETSFDIPVALSLKVLAGLMVLRVLLANFTGKFDFFGRLVGQSVGLLVLLGFLGFVVLMKEWLEARGDFKQYLAFFTQAQFVMLPLQILSLISSQLYGLCMLGILGWILFAFYKTFQILLSRFLILVGIVFGIGFLGVLATVLASLKLFL